MAEDTPITEPTVKRENKYKGLSISEIAAKRKQETTGADVETTRKKRMEELKQQREAGALQRSLARAATDPKYNFTQRPQGYIDEGNKVIRYYGWNGGKETGQWYAREAPLTERNYNTYKGLVSAAEIPVTSIKSKMNYKGKDGFVVTNTGELKTKGNVDPAVLGVKSDLDMTKVLAKAPIREEQMLKKALERAGTSPKYNFMERPAGTMDLDNIYFWSWIGGKVDGEWVQYVAPRTAENMEKYGTRVPTQKYYTPTSIRDALTPTLNVYGEDWATAKSKRKIVPNFDPNKYDAKFDSDGKIIIEIGKK